MLTDEHFTCNQYKSYLCRASVLGNELHQIYGEDAFYCFRFHKVDGKTFYLPAFREGGFGDDGLIYMTVIALIDIERDAILGTQVFGVVKDGVFIPLGKSLDEQYHGM